MMTTMGVVPVASDADTVWTTGGRSKRSLHTTPDCKNLANAAIVVEKPADVFPEGFFDWCEVCAGDDGGGHGGD